MTLPPWRSSDPADQRALTSFVIDELDKEDAQLAARAGDDAPNVGWLTNVAEAIFRGVPVKLPEPRKRPGPKPRSPGSDDFTDFDRAMLDVPRIRLIFKRHWGKRNRMVRPMAEEIAAERWELTAEERANLINHFQRKS